MSGQLRHGLFIHALVQKARHEVMPEHMLRTVQREYYGEGLEEADIMSAHDLTETELWRYLTYNTHTISIYDLIPQDAYGSGESFDPYEYLNPLLSENNVSWTVYRKICY